MNRIFSKDLIVLIIYSSLFMLSEVLYRFTFGITLFSFTQSVENFFFTFAIVTIFYFAKLYITRFLIILFFLISILANNIHYEIYRSWITGLNYYLAFKELDEVVLAGNSLVSKLLPHIIWGIIEIIIFLSLSKFRRKVSIYSDVLFILLLLFTFIKGIKAHQESILSPKITNGKIKQHYLALGHFIGKILPSEVFEISNVPFYKHPKPKKISEPKIKNIIVIMGESATAKHMSVFGYSRQTTPFFDNISTSINKPIIKEAYSAGTLTILSLPPLFNAIPYPNGHYQMNNGDTNLFRLAKERNYATYFYSAQAENQMGMINLIGKRWIDDVKFPSYLGMKVSENMPDEKLLPMFYKINLDSEENNLIVLHQRASHMPYGQLLQNKDHIFGNEKLLDKYDNTIYKTDQFIKEVFEHLNKRNKNDWLLVYTSDHGQYVTESINNQGTDEPDNYIVPFFLYTPDQHILQKMETVFSSCQKATHQQVITSIISILGYNLPIADCRRSYINNATLNGELGYLEIIQPNSIKHIQGIKR